MLWGTRPFMGCIDKMHNNLSWSTASPFWVNKSAAQDCADFFNGAFEAFRMKANVTVVEFDIPGAEAPMEELAEAAC